MQCFTRIIPPPYFNPECAMVLMTLFCRIIKIIKFGTNMIKVAAAPMPAAATLFDTFVKVAM